MCVPATPIVCLSLPDAARACRFLNSPQAHRRLTAAESDAGTLSSPFLFPTARPLALALASGKATAARLMLTALGRHGDALLAASSAPDLEAVAAAAPPSARRALWLQVLDRELEESAAAGQALCASMEATVERSKRELQLEDVLQRLPQGSGNARDAACLLARFCAAERRRFGALTQGLQGLGGKTRERKAALAALKRDRAASPGPVLAQGICGICGKALSAAPGRPLPHGAFSIVRFCPRRSAADPC